MRMSLDVKGHTKCLYQQHIETIYNMYTALNYTIWHNVLCEREYREDLNVQ